MLLAGSCVLLAGSCVLLAGCGPKAPFGAGDSQSVAAAAPKTRAIPVAVELAITGDIASYYTATATLEVEKEADVLARVSGLVERILKEEGDRVKDGESLLEIENDEYRLRADRAKTNTRTLQGSYDRMQKVARDLISTEEFEAAENLLSAAKTDEHLAALQLSYTDVKAPFAGRIVERYVDIGRNVSLGTPLYRVADFDPLLAYVHVPAKEFKKLRTDQIVELVLDSNKKKLEGRITLISPTIDPSTGTIEVRVEIEDYPAKTRPGDFAEVHIVTEKRISSTLIAKTAVINDKGEQVVYVNQDNEAERRVVEIGFVDEEHAEILSGVEAGEQIIIKGHRSLKNGSVIKPMHSPQPVSNQAAGSQNSG